MAAITPLPEPDLEALLSRYALGALDRYWPASNGIENSNYFLRVHDDGTQRDYVLTMLEQPANAGTLLVPLLDRTDAAGLPVPKVLRNRDGAANDAINGKPAIIARRLNGRHVFNPTVRQCEAVGRFLARFHRAALPIACHAPAYPRDPDWLVEHVALVSKHMPYGAVSLLRNATRAVAAMLARDDVRRLPQGIVHGDLFRDNVLFSEHGLTGVLDFHHAAKGTLLYDLAVATNDWCNDSSGVLDPDRTMALLLSYHRIRPLTTPELWFFAPFTLYAGVTFWLSRLSVAVRRDAAETMRLKNPDEFKAIVEQHWAHAFYPDPRHFC